MTLSASGQYDAMLSLVLSAFERSANAIADFAHPTLPIKRKRPQQSPTDG
jgi:hypothetical protein